MGRRKSGETCFECLASDDYCHVYTTEQWCKSKIKKWMEKYPDECKNFKEVGDSWFVQVPAKCMRTFRFPTRREPISEERKEALKKRMAYMRNKKQNYNSDEEFDDEDYDEDIDEDINDEDIEDEKDIEDIDDELNDELEDVKE